MYTRLNIGARHSLDEILKKLGNHPIPIAYGDYVTIVDLEDGIYYVLEPVASSLMVYPIIYEVKAAGKWNSVVVGLILSSKE